MRCRKVRSYLSAYSNDEVVGRDLVAVREHLSTCSSCRREEGLFSSMRQSARELKAAPLPADFNVKLLNRIAQERFAETRSRAYFPRVEPPLLLWRHLAPVLATAVALVVVGVMAFNKISSPMPSTATTSKSGSLDNSYLTVQPYGNPNMTTPLRKDWSFETQVAQAERSNQLSGLLTSAGSFGATDYRDALPRIAGFSVMESPFGVVIITVRPVLRVYDASGTSGSKEDEKVY